VKRKIYTTKDVSEELGISYRTVQQHHQLYGIGEKIAGRLIFSREDIEYIRSRKGRVGKPKKERE